MYIFLVAVLRTLFMVSSLGLRPPVMCVWHWVTVLGEISHSVLCHTPKCHSGIECIHELEVPGWLWGDYGGNYGGNIGPSHNLLITFVSITLLFFQRSAPGVKTQIGLRTVTVSTVVRPYVTATVTVPWRSGAAKIRPWFYGPGRHWSNSHDIHTSVAWLDSDQLNEAKFKVKIKLSQNLYAYGRHQWSAEPYFSVHGTAWVWAVLYRGG